MPDLDHGFEALMTLLVVRYIKLVNINEVDVKAVLSEIYQRFNIVNISFDEQISSLKVVYDISNVNLDGIEDVIHNHDLNISHNWWIRC